MSISGRRPFATLMEAAARLAAQLRGAFARGAYRPEQHYMRGPGPKARARLADAGALASGEE